MDSVTTIETNLERRVGHQPAISEFSALPEASRAREQRSSAPRLTAIVAAMREELAPLVRRMRGARRHRLSFGPALRGRLGAAEIILASTGEGRERARRGAAELLAAYPADLLIVVGVSGGLSPGLEPGALVAGSRLIDDDDGTSRPDAEWLDRALELRDVTRGTVLTCGRILCSAAEKEAARSRLGTPEPAVVDLESGAFAAAAAQRGVACLILRAVCDTAIEDLPLDFNACRRDDGRIDRLEVARRVAFSPRTVRDLMRLRRRVRTGSERLSNVVCRLLGEDERARG